MKFECQLAWLRVIFYKNIPVSFGRAHKKAANKKKTPKNELHCARHTNTVQVKNAKEMRVCVCVCVYCACVQEREREIQSDIGECSPHDHKQTHFQGLNSPVWSKTLQNVLFQRSTRCMIIVMHARHEQLSLPKLFVFTPNDFTSITTKSKALAKTNNSLSDAQLCKQI